MTRPDRELQEWADRGVEQVRLISKAAEPDKPRDGAIVYADGTNWNPSSQGAGIYWYGLGSWYRLATGAGIGLVDGDKGDIVVTATGLTWTIENDAVTFAKMQNIATDKLLGRVSSGSGNVEEVGVESFAAATTVAETDYVLVSQSGAHKKATVNQLTTAVFGEEWDDLRFPMNSVDPTGLAAPATRVTSTTGYTGALSFAGNAENVCAGIAQMPHSWKRESAIRPHIHWTKPTGSADAVTWELYLRVVGNPEDTAGAWSAALSPTGTVGDQTVSDEHLLTYWAPVDMTGLIESAIVYWRLHRQGGTDADNNAVICHELDFHYQTDKAGTEDEIPS